jgi:hypothetical protein
LNFEKVVGSNVKWGERGVFHGNMECESDMESMDILV